MPSALETDHDRVFRPRTMGCAQRVGTTCYVSLVRTSERQALGLALRRADRFVAAKIVAIAGLGLWFAFAGPFALAPICWGAATVLYWRRGVSVLAHLRSEPAAWPILDAAPTAKVVKDKEP